MASCTRFGSVVVSRVRVSRGTSTRAREAGASARCDVREGARHPPRMPGRMKLALLAATSLAFGLLACAADSDGPNGASEDDYKVKPGGTDTSAGKLVITSPVPLQGHDNARVTLPAEQGRAPRSMPMVLDTPIATKEGNVGLELVNRWGIVSASAMVKAGSTVTYALGAVQTSAAADLAKLATGSEVGVWRAAWDGGSTFRDLLAGMYPRPLPAGKLFHPQNELGRIIPTIPGSYHLSYGVFDGQDVVVEAGKIANVPLGDPSRRRLGLLRAPLRELPTCAVAAYTESPDARYAGGLQGSGWVTNPDVSRGGRPIVGQLVMRLASGEERLFGEYVGDPAITVTKTAYTFFLPRGLEVPVAVAGKPGDPPAVTTWARLDVDDVEVTMDDGSKRVVRGTWSLLHASGSPIVSWPGKSGQFKVPGCETGTGIDLPFGKYKLLVRYTREGFTQPGTETYDLDLTP